ncbi:MAG: sigma 54-interacting transcriptional regulator [Vicinamibacterales bacterium]
MVRALVVSGRLNFFLGKPALGQQRFRKARELAAEGPDPALLALAVGQHLEALLRFVSLEAAVGDIASYRRIAHRAGTHASLALLHKILAEAELKSGRGLRAVKELELSWLHVNALGDKVLEAQLLFARGAAHGSLGEVSEAYGYAQDAVALSGRLGAHAISRSGQVNVAHLQIVMGLHNEAATTLDFLTRQSYASVDRELDVSANRLQLLCYRRDLAAVDIDSRFGQVAATRSTVSAQWYKLARVEYLTRLGDPREAVALGLECLELSSRDDRDYLARLRGATAEAMAMLGREPETAALISDVVLGQLGGLPEFVAIAQRVFGRLSADSTAAALEHFDRAARVFGEIGHVVGRGESLHRAATLRADQAGGVSVPPVTDFYAAPPMGFGRISPAGAGLDATAEFASAAVSRAAAAMVDLASRPALAGFELLSILATTGAAQGAVLLAGKGRRQDVLGWTGGDEPDMALLEASDRQVRFDLGTDRDRAVTAVVRPGSHRSARATLLALQRLVGHARTLHAAAVAESERSALWPEPLPEQQLGFVCASESMLSLLTITRRVAASNITVLITGETGTGKELLARALHNSSPRKAQRFLPFNCTAVARDMLDSQLFGYRRGAFTGAHDAFPGVIRSAAGGTLFLDEIGEIGLDVQPKLLRFLESAEVHPLGEPAPVPVDVRIVAATNANLDALVSQGKFREDLYYRLNVVKLTIPPLRERREEIPLLVDHFLLRMQKETGKSGMRIDEATAEYLLLYDWPGNVRELVNEIRRAVALAESGAVLMPEHLSPRLAATRRTVPAGQRPPTPTELLVRRDQPLSAAVEHVERALIQDALRRHRNVEDAARALGLSRKGLYLKRQRLRIDEQVAER